jgi:hypothetical protein
MNNPCRLAAIGVFMAGALATQATMLNFDPSSTPPAPVLDAGWAYDQINAAWVNSADSPYVYNLGGWATLTVTDDFIQGDVYRVFDSGTLILETTFTPGGQPLGGFVGGDGYS